MSLALFAPLLASAANTVLCLNNGDRISGELLRRAEGRIFFRSPFLGDISVAESDATIAMEPDTPVESLAGIPLVTPPARSTTNTPTPSSEKLSEVAKKESSARKENWRMKIEFGFFQQSGRRDLTTFSSRFDAERKKGGNDTKFSSRMLYGEQDGKTSSERYDASFRYRREVSKRAFAQSLSSYSTDRVKKIDLNFEENLGAGFHLIKKAEHAVNAGLGATVRIREANGIKEETSILGEFFQDYTYRLNGRLSFLQDTNVLYSPRPTSNGESDVNNYRFRFNSALQGKVSERVSLNLRYEYEYDNAVPFGGEKRDQRITSSVGYSL